MIFLLPKWERLVTSLQGILTSFTLIRGKALSLKPTVTIELWSSLFGKQRSYPPWERSHKSHQRGSKRKIIDSSSCQPLIDGRCYCSSRRGFSDLMVPKNIRKAQNWKFLKLGNHIPHDFSRKCL